MTDTTPISGLTDEVTSLNDNDLLVADVDLSTTPKTAKLSWTNLLAQLKGLFLAKDNATTWTPSGDYNPATKKYVDDKADSGEISIDTIGTPADIDTVQEWLNATQSAAKLSGGEFTDNGDGTIKVAAGWGFIKTSDSGTAETKAFAWSENASVSLTDGAANYIYVDYNSGSPVVTASTSIPTDHNTKVLLGFVYRDGTTLYEVDAGQAFDNFATRVFWRDIEVNGKMRRSDGIIIGEETDRKVSVTSGHYYAGLTKKSLGAVDTSGSDTFTYVYRDGSGGHTLVTGQTQIDNEHYDDGSGTLATLSGGWSKNYGVHWAYMTTDGKLWVVYGTGDYSLTEAQAAAPPTDIPDVLAEAGALIGKIIIQKDATSFTSIQSAFEIRFAPPGGHRHPASDIDVDTTNFNGNLSSADDTVQKALETLDDMTSGGGSIDVQTVWAYNA